VFRLQESQDRAGSREEGFTLAELLVVVVILGILAAVVVFAVGNSTDNAKSSACDAERSTLETAIEAYRAQTGEYPTSNTALTQTETRFLRHEPTLYQVNASGDGSISRTDAGIDQECDPVT
jgi:general secretion pathway protein G